MLDTDFAFHWDGGGEDFKHLHPVRFEIDDSMSAPFEARIVLHTRKPDDDLDPLDLVGKLATLRIATGSKPACRAFHGLIVAAEDRGSSVHGSLYEVVLMPPLARAMHRRRCRIFLDKTLKAIVEAVLKGDPKMTAGDSDCTPPDHLYDSFTAPEEKFVWRVKDTARLTDPKVRPHCVQYMESDFAFVSRLLEEEGISYHFEHTAKQIVFVMSDNDSGRLKLDPFDALAPDLAGRHLDQVRMGGKLRPTSVKHIDYNWQKPNLKMHAEVKGESDDLFVQRYPARFHESPDQGSPLAKAELERFQTEARHAAAAGSCRLLGAGSIFSLQHPVARLEGEYLVTKCKLRGFAEGELPPGHDYGEKLAHGGPFWSVLELVKRGKGSSPEESKFRPAQATPKPRIYGTQTAKVVDEPSARGAEIHVGGPEGNENGCVRLLFPWDTETDRHDKEPSSTWVRVSQTFAGAGGGAVSHPRVGTEVIVAYDDGDPDRPIVVGRVYNGVQPAAANGKGAATTTTMKSLSSPGGKVFNEFKFEDAAGKEEVGLHAGKDWNSTVGHDRTEAVKNNSKSSVDVDRSESTGGNRDTKVTGNNTEDVGGHEKISVGGSQEVKITGTQKIQTTGDRALSVGGSNKIDVASAEEHHIGAGHTVTVAASQEVSVGANKTDTIAATYEIKVPVMNVNAASLHHLKTPTSITDAPVCTTHSAAWAVSASGSAHITTASFKAASSGAATIQGATVTVSASGDVTISGGSVKIKGGNISLEGGSIKIAGGTVDITGGVVNVN